jgi:release factor glutamine methyltransferase
VGRTVADDVVTDPQKARGRPTAPAMSAPRAAPPTDSPRSVATGLHDGTRCLGASVTARLDAEILLAHVLGVSRAALLARGRDPLDPDDDGRFAALVARRAAGEPVPYLVGRCHFYGLELEVTPDVLIPRPETELLVAWALERLGAATEVRDAVDVGTGSGAVALALARNAPGTCWHGTDTSAAALAVAERNARGLGPGTTVIWHQVDLLPDAPRRFGLVVANLPYIGRDELADVAPGVLRYEPHDALFAGRDGLAVIRRLLAALPGRVTPGGDVGLEIGWRQGPAVVALAKAALPGGRVMLHRDLAGLPRVVTIEGVRGD